MTRRPLTRPSSLRSDFIGTRPVSQERTASRGAPNLLPHCAGRHGCCSRGRHTARRERPTPPCPWPAGLRNHLRSLLRGHSIQTRAERGRTASGPPSASGSRRHGFRRDRAFAGIASANPSPREQRASLKSYPYPSVTASRPLFAEWLRKSSNLSRNGSAGRINSCGPSPGISRRAIRSAPRVTGSTGSPGRR